MILSIRTLKMLIVLQITTSHAYVKLTALKTKLFHKIMINSKVNQDFKQLSPQDASQLASFWHDELMHANTSPNIPNPDMRCLYNAHIKDSEVQNNLTDFKYEVQVDINQINKYYIWRPKIQICLPSLHSVSIVDSNINKTLLYPSFRETMYLFSIVCDKSNGVTIKSIVQSPYWHDLKHESYDILQNSLKEYFMEKLKYPKIIHNT